MKSLYQDLCNVQELLTQRPVAECTPIMMFKTVGSFLNEVSPITKITTLSDYKKYNVRTFYIQSSAKYRLVLTFENNSEALITAVVMLDGPSMCVLQLESIAFGVLDTNTASKLIDVSYDHCHNDEK